MTEKRFNISDPDPQPAAAPARIRPKPRSKDAAKAAPRRPISSLLARVLRRKPVPEEGLPHATFSRTPTGIRSIVSAGNGAPTVVFESGLGHGKRTWVPVFNAVSEVTRTVAYDRAGYGQSEPSDQSRDGLQIVLELRALLQTEGIAPPYVLVGHSLGGTYMKLYAKTYPDEVAGVVLVDARHAEFTQRCAQLGVARVLYDPPEALMSVLPPTARAELAAARLTLKQVRRAGPFPSVPLIVLTQRQAATQWPQRLGKVWAASQRNMAKMSKLGRIKVLDDSGHNVHKDRPEVVIRAILSVVRAARYVAVRKRKALAPPHRGPVRDG